MRIMRIRDNRASGQVLLTNQSAPLDGKMHVLARTRMRAVTVARSLWCTGSQRKQRETQFLRRVAFQGLSQGVHKRTYTGVPGRT